VSLLALETVCAAYGKVPVIQDVSLELEEGESVALMGANGAGKTTTLRAISGVLSPRAGNVRFCGQDITRLSAARVVRLGLAHCPEGREVFADMSVLENLELGAYTRHDGRIAQDLRRIYQLFPVLKERLKQAAGSLSGGEQQMLAIGRALMSQPRLILFDEPSLGLSPLLVKQVAQAIKTLNQSGLSVLLVEQNVYVAFAVATRGYVMENGRLTLSGPMEALRADRRVRQAYLGG